MQDPGSFLVRQDSYLSNMNSDEKLIQGFRARDEKVILRFYDDLLDSARRIMPKMGASSQDIEDLVQETVTSLYTNIQSGAYVYNPDVKLTTYAFQICKYRWFNMSKRLERKNISLDTDFFDPIDDQRIDREIEVVERNHKIADAVSKLGDQCREILRKFYWEGRSMQEIAKELNMQPNSVKNGKYRCMKQLSNIIDEKDKDQWT